MLKVLEGTIGAESLDLVAVGYGRANLDHVLDAHPVKVGRSAEQQNARAIHHLPHFTPTSKYCLRLALLSHTLCAP